MEEATRQDLFNQVAQHARTQRKRSFDNGCAYLSPNGLKCFIGCFISPEEYEDFDIRSVNRCGTALLEEHLQRNNTNVSLCQINYLSALQQIHDVNVVSQWDGCFKSFAERYNLEYAPEPIIEVE